MRETNLAFIPPRPSAASRPPATVLDDEIDAVTGTSLDKGVEPRKPIYSGE
jgi:hypothetical protein